MQVQSQLNNLRIAPRKVRTLTNIIKGMNAIDARHQLVYITKRSSTPVSKLIDSAVANAANNFGLVKENLFIRDVIVNEGRKLKRYRPKGFGSSSPIEKKTSHITIILEEKVPGLRADTAKDATPADKKADEKKKPARKTTRAKKEEQPTE